MLFPTLAFDEYLQFRVKSKCIPFSELMLGRCPGASHGGVYACVSLESYEFFF